MKRFKNKNNFQENNGSSGSMSEYFRAGTSRIGYSFEHSSSGSSLQRHRPSFGFGTFRSPQRQPVAVVTAMSSSNTAMSPTSTAMSPTNTAMSPTRNVMSTSNSAISPPSASRTDQKEDQVNIRFNSSLKKKFKDFVKQTK